MHRVRDLDPSCGCGHVQISSRGHVGRHVTRGRHVATHEEKCTAAPCLCSLSDWDRQLTIAIWNLFSLQNITSDGCAESWASEKPIVYTTAAVVVADDDVVRLIWWQMTVHNSRPVQWPGHFFVCIYSKDRGSQPALSFCVGFGYYSWCFVYHVSEYLIVINIYSIIRLHIIIIFKLYHYASQSVDTLTPTSGCLYILRK